VPVPVVDSMNWRRGLEEARGAKVLVIAIRIDMGPELARGLGTSSSPSRYSRRSPRSTHCGRCAIIDENGALATSSDPGFRSLIPASRKAGCI
jgi:hypothetical protein